MNRVLTAATLAATCLSAIPASAQKPVYKSTTEHGGVVHTTEVLKSGKHLETVKCADFGALDESFKPQAVTYAANYGPKGHAHNPTMTVSGTEKVLPMIVADCKAHPGESLVTRVHAALAKM